VVINVFNWIHLLMTIGLITVILLQSGRSAGLGSIGGGAEALFKKRRKGLDELFSRLTVILATAFMVTAVILTFYKG